MYHNNKHQRLGHASRLLYASVARVTIDNIPLAMAATALPVVSSFDLINPLSFLRESLELKERSDRFELNGVRRMIGYITMLAKTQLSAIYA